MELLLIKNAQKGDRDAFVKLMERHKQSLYKVARSYLRSDEDIADVLQDTVLSAYEHIRELKRASYFRTWLTRILINNCCDLLRQQKHYIAAAYEDAQEAALSGKSADDRAFYELLEELPEEMRPIFILYYGDGFRIREIAQILGMNENTVKSKLQRGREKLKKAICC